MQTRDSRLHLLPQLTVKSILGRNNWCEVCEKTVVNFRRHMRDVHNNTEVQCEVCQKVFKNDSSCKKHMRVLHNVYQLVNHWYFDNNKMLRIHWFWLLFFKSTTIAASSRAPPQTWLISFLQGRFTVETAINTLTQSTSQGTQGMYMERIIMSSAQCVRRFSKMIRLVKSICE